MNCVGYTVAARFGVARAAAPIVAALTITANPASCLPRDTPQRRKSKAPNEGTTRAALEVHGRVDFATRGSGVPIRGSTSPRRDVSPLLTRAYLGCRGPPRSRFPACQARNFSSQAMVHYLSNSCRVSYHGRPIVSPSSLAPSRRWFVKAPKGIIVMYEHLPTEYRDAQGLPFRAHDLTVDEAWEIFGAKIHVDDANRLLRILHGRRVAGTLDDPAYRVHTSAFRPEHIARGLVYLRETVAVDEVINAGLRAQDELEQLERAEQEAQEAANTAREAARRPAQEQQQAEAQPHAVEDAPPPKQKSVYGWSALDGIRARNIAKREAEEKRREEERRSQPAPVAGTLAAYVERGEMSPAMQKWMEKGMSDIQEAPDMPTVRRIGPTLVLGVLMSIAAIGFAEYYPHVSDMAESLVSSPPANPETGSSRSHRDGSSMKTVATIIGLNVLVFAAWKVPPFWGFLNRYFVLVMGLPKPISLVLAPFSHSSFVHLAANMSALYFLGPRLHDDLGRGHFLGLYATSGIAGYVASLVWHPVHVASLGASCAVYGVAAAYFWLHRLDTFKILHLPPDPMEGVPGLVFLALIVGLHISAGITSLRAFSALDLVSHWGGIVAGIAWITALEQRGWFSPAEPPEEPRKAVAEAVDATAEPKKKTRRVIEMTERS